MGWGAGPQGACMAKRYGRWKPDLANIRDLFALGLGLPKLANTDKTLLVELTTVAMINSVTTTTQSTNFEGHIMKSEFCPLEIPFRLH